MPAKDRAAEATAAASEVDAILAGLPEEFRATLTALRATIAAAAPEAVEAISYANPAFKYRGRPLVSYGAATNHCSFYVMSPAVMDAHQDDLAAFETSKGTIRFQPSDPLPNDLVTRLVRARIAETDAARG